MIPESQTQARGLLLLFTARLGECEGYYDALLKAPARHSRTTRRAGNGDAADDDDVDEDDEDAALLRRSERIRHSIGLSLVSVVKALITFDDKERNETMARLQEAQKIAASSIRDDGTGVGGAMSKALNGWFTNSTKAKSSRSSSSSPSARGGEITDEVRFLLHLDCDLGTAETHLFSALLQFMQETPLSVTRGFLLIRKAYKTFHKCKVELDRRYGGHQASSYSLMNESSFRVDAVLYEQDVYYDCEEEFRTESPGANEEGFGELVRPGSSLRAAVEGSCKLGLGCFNLVFSLIPPRAQYWLAKFGFGEVSTNREAGLKMLREAVELRTSRSPVAALVLLIFHSAMLLVAHAVSNDGDIRVATAVLNACLRQYPSSPLFRFFEGRLARSSSRLTHAAENYRVAHHLSRDVVPLKHLCAYERGWIALIRGHYVEAGEAFAYVARESPWSPAFYSYLSAAALFEQAARLLACDGYDAAFSPEESRDRARKALKRAFLTMHNVAGAVRARNGPGGKKGVIPPEAYALAKSTEALEHARRVLGLTAADDAGSEALSRALGSTTPPMREQLMELVCGLFSPGEELSYFWNGIFQLSTHEKRLQMRQTEEVGNAVRRAMPEMFRTRFEPVHLLVRASYFRELGMGTDAMGCLDRVLESSFAANGTDLSRWVREYARFERGLCRMHLFRDTTGALAEFNSVSDSGHVFDARLRFKLRFAVAAAGGAG